MNDDEPDGTSWMGWAGYVVVWNGRATLRVSEACRAFTNDTQYLVENGAVVAFGRRS